MKKKYGKVWGVWLNDKESALLDAYLKANDLNYSELARQLVMAHLMQDDSESSSKLLKELLLDSEPNILRPATQVKQLKASLHSPLMLGELLALITGDRKKAHEIYTRTGEKVDQLVTQSGYKFSSDDEEGDT